MLVLVKVGGVLRVSTPMCTTNWIALTELHHLPIASTNARRLRMIDSLMIIVTVERGLNVDLLSLNIEQLPSNADVNIMFEEVATRYGVISAGVLFRTRRRLQHSCGATVVLRSRGLRRMRMQQSRQR